MAVDRIVVFGGQEGGEQAQARHGLHARPPLARGRRGREPGERGRAPRQPVAQGREGGRGDRRRPEQGRGDPRGLAGLDRAGEPGARVDVDGRRRRERRAPALDLQPGDERARAGVRPGQAARARWPRPDRGAVDGEPAGPAGLEDPRQRLRAGLVGQPVDREGVDHRQARQVADDAAVRRAEVLRARRRRRVGRIWAAVGREGAVLAEPGRDRLHAELRHAGLVADRHEHVDHALGDVVRVALARRLRRPGEVLEPGLDVRREVGVRGGRGPVGPRRGRA